MVGRAVDAYSSGDRREAGTVSPQHLPGHAFAKPMQTLLVHSGNLSRLAGNPP